MDRRSLLKAGVAGAAFTAAPYFFTRPSQAQGKYKEEYKLSTVVGLPFPWGQGGDIWAKLVRERTEGRINIKMYPGVSLVNGDQTREFTAIRQGVIDLAVGSTINWSPQIKQLNLSRCPSCRRITPVSMPWCRARSARRSCSSSRRMASYRWPGARTASAR